MPDNSVMSEITKISENKITAAESFVLHWGDMGIHWGMSRSVCQVHALLYLAEKPMNAEEVGSALNLARSNVSTSVKELLGWGLIKRVPLPNERRDHFVAEGDIWEIAKRIAMRRKEREIDLALAALRSTVALAETEKNPETARRLKLMLQFTENIDRWYSEMLRLPVGKLEMLMKIGSKVIGLLPGGKA